MTSRLRKEQIDAPSTSRGPGKPLVGEHQRRQNAGPARRRKTKPIARPKADGTAAVAEVSPEPNMEAAARPTWQRYWYLSVFAVYLGIVGVTVAHHEPWLDEAQAWLIARDAAWSDLFCTLPRYEGSPILWHLILTLPARCGLPYASLNVIAAALSASGVLLFLARSPLPKLLTALVPFTFFLIYQNAVVARSYALMPLLLFAAAAAYPSRLRRPFLYVLPLGFLAHVSAHGWLIATSLVGLLSIEVFACWWRQREMLPWRRAALAVGLFGLVALGAAWQMRPVADHVRGLANDYPLWPRIHFAVERLSGMFTDAYVPSLLVLVASLAWFRYARALAVYAVPTAAVLALFVIANCWYHHEQVLFLIWLFALWVSFQNVRGMANQGAPRALWLRRSWIGLVGAVFAVQVYWAAASVGEDLRGTYSGAKALAEYLKREGLDSKRVACSDVYSVAALPYFDRNIFVNLHNGRGSSFAVWSDQYLQARSFGTLTPYREPFDVLVLGVKASPFCRWPWHEPAMELPLSHEYRCVGYFPGNIFWKTGAYERDDYVCYVRNSIPASRYEPGISAAQRCELRVRNIEAIQTGVEEAINTPEKARAAAHSAFAMMLRLLDRQTAVEHFRTAVKLWPTRGANHSNLGAILERTNPDEALRHFRTALELDPKNVAAYTNLGNILARSGRLDAAIVCYRDALTLDPNLVEARSNLRLAAALRQTRRPPVRGGDRGRTAP
jgi:tetratricopeptide (TPR) repeat protein